jgi:hypothetical protein
MTGESLTSKAIVRSASGRCVSIRQMAASTITGGRVSDLHKSAFWIYGVTAMVMREPFASVIRHASTAGLGDWQVRLELVRIAVVLVLMARQFLLLGLYFDQVYIRPDAAARFPRRSYPIDFLTGLMQLLTIVAASTAVGLHARMWAGLTIFMILVGVFLLFEIGWLAVSAMLRFSSVPLIAKFAKFNGLTLAAVIVAWSAVRAAGRDSVFIDQCAFTIMLAFTLFEMGQLVRTYDQPAPVTAI